MELLTFPEAFAVALAFPVAPTTLATASTEGLWNDDDDFPPKRNDDDDDDDFPQKIGVNSEFLMFLQTFLLTSVCKPLQALSTRRRGFMLTEVFCNNLYYVRGAMLEEVLPLVL
jgi:hypothetical protein